MSTRPAVPLATAPEWLVAEMPAGYQTRFAEIQRLSSEMHAMDRVARLLWETGEPLHEAVGDALSSFKLEVDAVPAAPEALTVKLDGKRRLLVQVATADSTIEKKSPELASVFRLVHEVAGSDDRVVLATNTDRLAPPKGRPAPASKEALDLLGRLGVNVLPTPTLFALWTQAQQDLQRTKTYLDRLHAQDGGLAPAAG